MNTQARDFRNLKTCVQEDRLGQVSVSSVVDICKSYAQSEGTIDGNIEKDVKGSVECLQAPIKFICQQIREKIRDVVQRNPANTQEILKITAFYLSIITNIIEFFPGDLLPHSFMILENLFYLQSVKFLVKSDRAEEINKIITTPFMKNIGTLRKNTQFIECLLNANYSHDSERYAFLMISLEMLKAMIKDKNLKDQETAEKSEVIQKIFSVIPK
uniref:Uncharacterized protein n=1 Tax=Phlebotomus papatasi TaxID=29031 RepID=A0A1B0DMM6_PHLPP